MKVELSNVFFIFTKDSPPHIMLRLQPVQSMCQNESHVSVDLNVKFCEEYPNR